MQKTERKFRIDIKWIIILSIIAFLLIFEVFPLLYLFVKSIFPNGSFTLEAFKRVYSYDANFIAIRNTIVTAVATTFFGMLKNLMPFSLAKFSKFVPGSVMMRKFLPKF